MICSGGREKNTTLKKEGRRRRGTENFGMKNSRKMEGRRVKEEGEREARAT